MAPLGHSILRNSTLKENNYSDINISNLPVSSNRANLNFFGSLRRQTILDLSHIDLFCEAVSATQNLEAAHQIVGYLDVVPSCSHPNLYKNPFKSGGMEKQNAVAAFPENVEDVHDDIGRHSVCEGMREWFPRNWESNQFRHS